MEEWLWNGMGDALLKRIPETDDTASHVYTYKSKWWYPYGFFYLNNIPLKN